MTKTTKFKIELEVTVEYDVPTEAPSTPYTSLEYWVNKYNELVINSQAGKIAEATINKVTRDVESSNE